MASVSFDRAGRAMVRFMGPDRNRRTIRLGKMSERNAERFAEKVEQLASAAKHGTQLDEDVIAWTRKLGDAVASKLADYGLLKRRAVSTLGPFVKAYIDHRRPKDDQGVTAKRGKKPRTIVTYEQTESLLLRYFGADRRLDAITSGDADDFKLWALRAGGMVENPGDRDGKKLSISTVNRRCAIVAQFLKAAVRKNVIVSNPFAGIGAGVKSNKDRMYFLGRDDAAKVHESCPDAEWQLIFALARFGGLRCPSEIDGLRLDEIDWSRSKFLVHSPKTEHHQGGESRWVPIFPELSKHLLAAAERAEPGQVYVLAKYRGQQNLRTRFRKIIKRAGLKPWPKLFQNLRSTRQTELAAVYPLHLVCAWLGNKAAIAQEHYLQVTDADFEKAANAASAPPALHNGAKPKQLEGMPAFGKPAKPNIGDLQLSPMSIGAIDSVGPEGLERTDGFSANHSETPDRAPLALQFGQKPSSADLEEVAVAWPSLPDSVRVSILRMVRESRR